jgi:ABC-type dipeptide/oligopeptide/nickel transport systems, permease components
MSRWRYFGRRVALSIPILLFAMSLVFLITRAGPADPVRNIIGPTSGAGDYHRIAIRLGIERRVVRGGEVTYVDVPLWQQYIDFMTDFLTFDLGRAWVVSELPVVELIAVRAPRTIWLGFWSVLIALFVGIPLGFYAGLNPNTRSDYIASFGGIVWRAMPNFWLAVILVELLSNTQSLSASPGRTSWWRQPSFGRRI